MVKRIFLVIFWTGIVVFINSSYLRAELLWKYDLKEANDVHSIAISADGNYVLAMANARGEGSKNSALLNKEGKVIWEKNWTWGQIDVAISADGKAYACGFPVAISADGLWTVKASTSYEKTRGNITIHFINNKTKESWSYKTDRSDGSGILVSWSVAISPDGSYAALGAGNNLVYFFDNKNKRLLWKYEADMDVISVSISEDGKCLAAGSNDGYVYFFSQEGKLLWKYKVNFPVVTVSLSKDGNYLALGSYNRYVWFLNKDGELLWRYKAGKAVTSTSISADGKYIVAGSRDKNIYSFNRAGKLLWEYKTGDCVDSVDISEDGSCVVGGSRDGFIYFFDNFK